MQQRRCSLAILQIFTFPRSYTMYIKSSASRCSDDTCFCFDHDFFLDSNAPTRHTDRENDNRPFHAKRTQHWPAQTPHKILGGTRHQALDCSSAAFSAEIGWVPGRCSLVLVSDKNTTKYVRQEGPCLKQRNASSQLRPAAESQFLRGNARATAMERSRLQTYYGETHVFQLRPASRPHLQQRQAGPQGVVTTLCSCLGYHSPGPSNELLLPSAKN